MLNVVARSRASSSSHRFPLTDRDLARQIAGGRHLAHDVGDVGQGAGNRPRHREAEDRREQHRDDRRDGQPGVNGLQAAKQLGARPENQRHRTGPHRQTAQLSPPERPRQHEVVLSRDGQVRDARRPQSPAEHAVHLARQRGGENLPVHPEGDIAARDRLQLRRERVVEQEPDADRAEDLRLRQADRNRHRHELQHAVGLRQQAEAFVPAKRLAHGRLAGDDERRLRRSRRPWRARRPIGS